MPLYLHLFIFYTIDTFIHHSFVNIRWGPSPYLHSCRLSVWNLNGVPSRDSNSGCLSASQRATNWATLHPKSHTAHCIKYIVITIVWMSIVHGLVKERRPHCNVNPIYVFPEKELCGLIPNFRMHVSVSGLYIPRMGPHIFLCNKNTQTERGNI